MPKTHTEIFRPQYAERSGSGSTLAYTAPYRAFLERFIKEHDVRRILDFGCGDMEVMGNIDLTSIEYFGIDCIPERVARNMERFPPDAFPHMRFHCDDVRHYPGWVEGWADLLVMKDVLQHWSNADITQFMERADFRRALFTNCNYRDDTVNTDIATGGWRSLDLTKPPFELGRVVFQWETKDVVLVEDRHGAWADYDRRQTTKEIT